MSDIASRLYIALQDCKVSGPVPLADIQAAQQALGLLFPPSYRCFLAEVRRRVRCRIRNSGSPAPIYGSKRNPIVVERSLRHTIIPSGFVAK